MRGSDSVGLLVSGALRKRWAIQGASEMGGRWKAQLVVGEFLSEAKEVSCPSPQPFHHIAESFCSQVNEV